MSFFSALYHVILFSNTPQEQSSSSSISYRGSITYSPSNVNLAVIPDDWSLTYGSGLQVIHLDYSVTHNACMTPIPTMMSIMQEKTKRGYGTPLDQSTTLLQNVEYYVVTAALKTQTLMMVCASK